MQPSAGTVSDLRQNAPAADPRAAAAEAAGPPRRAAARDDDRARPRAPPLDHLPPAQRAERRGLRRPPARGAPLRARRRRLRARLAPTCARTRCAGSPQTVLTRLVAATTHNAHLAVLARPRRALRDRGARARPPGPGDRRRRPAPRAPDRERPGDARRAPAAAGQRALPQPPRAHPPPRRRPRLADPAARAARDGPPRRPRRGGRLRHARASPRSPARCSTTPATRSPRSRSPIPADEATPAALADHVRRAAARVATRIRGTPA